MLMLSMQRSEAEMLSPYCATACAHANIALIKYWGKADESLVIPTTSSLSLTLDGLTTQTTVEFHADDESCEQAGASATGSPLLHDTLSIDGQEQIGTSLQRVSKFLDVIRERAGIALPARVVSHNTVPFGAGLASSASAFAALAAAASRAAGLELSDRELSRIARRGSGSACRSIYGGLVKWNAGHDDESSYAEPVESPLDLAIIVVLISAKEKPMSSREAMRLTVRTSPLYPAWVRASEVDMCDALAAVSHSDLRALGAVAEANALGMHAAMMSARPGVVYWLPQTVAALAAVRDMRTQGFDVWFTMDAGANVKVLALASEAEHVADELRNRMPDCAVEVHHPGSGVRIVH